MANPQVRETSVDDLIEEIIDRAAGGTIGEPSYLDLVENLSRVAPDRLKAKLQYLAERKGDFEQQEGWATFGVLSIKSLWCALVSRNVPTWPEYKKDELVPPLCDDVHFHRWCGVPLPYREGSGDGYTAGTWIDYEWERDKERSKILPVPAFPGKALLDGAMKTDCLRSRELPDERIVGQIIGEAAKSDAGLAARLMLGDEATATLPRRKTWNRRKVAEWRRNVLVVALSVLGTRAALHRLIVDFRALRPRPREGIFPVRIDNFRLLARILMDLGRGGVVTAYRRRLVLQKKSEELKSFDALVGSRRVLKTALARLSAQKNPNDLVNVIRFFYSKSLVGREWDMQVAALRTAVSIGRDGTSKGAVLGAATVNGVEFPMVRVGLPMLTFLQAWYEDGGGGGRKEDRDLVSEELGVYPDPISQAEKLLELTKRGILEPVERGRPSPLNFVRRRYIKYICFTDGVVTRSGLALSATVKGRVLHLGIRNLRKSSVFFDPLPFAFSQARLEGDLVIDYGSVGWLKALAVRERNEYVSIAPGCVYWIDVDLGPLVVCRSIDKLEISYLDGFGACRERLAGVFISLLSFALERKGGKWVLVERG